MKISRLIFGLVSLSTIFTPAACTLPDGFGELLDAINLFDGNARILADAVSLASEGFSKRTRIQRRSMADLVSPYQSVTQAASRVQVAIQNVEDGPNTLTGDQLNTCTSALQPAINLCAQANSDIGNLLSSAGKANSNMGVWNTLVSQQLGTVNGLANDIKQVFPTDPPQLNKLIAKLQNCNGITGLFNSVIGGS